MDIYIPNGFKIQELVPKAFYETAKAQGKAHLLWLAFDYRALWTLVQLRKLYGPTTVNNWLWGGDLEERGLRLLGTSTGASLSQHIFGRGIDANFKYATAEEVRDDMRKAGCFDAGFYEKNPDSPFKYIRCVESTLNGKPISWFHMDFRPITNNYVYQLHI